MTERRRLHEVCALIDHMTELVREIEERCRTCRHAPNGIERNEVGAVNRDVEMLVVSQLAAPHSCDAPIVATIE